ncbi:MAG: DUF805 domain-containing protein [Clostridia bacterium]|nr:DUF805 domain-containing protein [Clostridia bacterium]
MQYYIDVIKKYAVFGGRARRKEYWMFVLFNAIASYILSFVDNLAGLTLKLGETPIGILSLIYSLFILLPSLGVCIRRLHDIDKSGWWLLIGLIPIVGWIILLVFYCKEGTAGENQYGADPKAGEAVPPVNPSI